MLCGTLHSISGSKSSCIDDYNDFTHQRETSAMLHLRLAYEPVVQDSWSLGRGSKTLVAVLLSSEQS